MKANYALISVIGAQKWGIIIYDSLLQEYNKPAV